MVDGAATVSYNWAFGDGAVGSGASAMHTYLTAQSVTATLTVSYSGLTGCSDSQDSGIIISAATAPTIDVEGGVTEICGDGTEQLVLTVMPDFVKYTWMPSGSSKSINVSTPGTYSVVTEDAGGCVGNAEVTLASKVGCEGGQGPPIDIEAMKAFTPNGDGSNDAWGIRKIENYPGCILNVFDRRGRRIYQINAENYPVYQEGGNSLGWDGVAEGKQVPNGTYYFVLGCPDRDKPYTGTVLIVR
jgi:gliding motility-associated-like protein